MIAILGKTGAGKTTIAGELARLFGMQEVILYTTRAKRADEEAGTSHFFITESEFEEKLANGEFAVVMNFNEKKYCIDKRDCVDNSVCAITQSVLDKMKKMEGINLTSIYIKVSQKVRKKRLLSRGDSESQIENRFFLDELDLKNVESNVDFVFENNGNLFEVLGKIKSKLSLGQKFRE